MAVDPTLKAQYLDQLGVKRQGLQDQLKSLQEQLAVVQMEQQAILSLSASGPKGIDQATIILSKAAGITSGNLSDLSASVQRLQTEIEAVNNYYTTVQNL